MKTGICIAMPEEASLLLELFKITDNPEKPYGNSMFYDTDKITVAVSGVGSLAAAMATQLLIAKYGCDNIISMGSCGCTGTKFNIGDIISVDKLYKGDVDLTVFNYDKYQLPKTPTFIEAEIDDNYQHATCRSTDRFIMSGSGIEPDTLTEMEGFAVAYTCYKYGIPCRVYKIISDLCDKNTDATEHDTNLQQVSDTLGKHIFEMLNK